MSWPLPVSWFVILPNPRTSTNGHANMPEWNDELVDYVNKSCRSNITQYRIRYSYMFKEIIYIYISNINIYIYRTVYCILYTLGL